MSEAKEVVEAKENIDDIYDLMIKLVAKTKVDLRMCLEIAERFLAEAVRLQTTDLCAQESESSEVETYLTEVYQETIELFLRVRALESKVFKKRAQDD